MAASWRFGDILLLYAYTIYKKQKQGESNFLSEVGLRHSGQINSLTYNSQMDLLINVYPSRHISLRSELTPKILQFSTRIIRFTSPHFIVSDKDQNFG